MRLLHSLAKTHVSFDDPNLVSHAGLVPVMALAQRAGLGDLVAQHVRPGGDCGVNAHLKIPCLTHTDPDQARSPRQARVRYRAYIYVERISGQVYGGRELRRGIRQRGMGYVLAVRANHTVTTGSGRTVTAAGAAGLIPARAWQRMRTGSGTKGTRCYDWAMLKVASDDTPRRARRRAQRPAGPAAPLHRPAVVLPVLDTRAGPAVPADRRRIGQVASGYVICQGVRAGECLISCSAAHGRCFTVTSRSGKARFSGVTLSPECWSLAVSRLLSSSSWPARSARIWIWLA